MTRRPSDPSLSRPSSFPRRSARHASIATHLRLAAHLVPVLAAALLGARSAAQAPCGYAIEYGINPSFQTWTSRAIVFPDAMQRSREFVYWAGGPQGKAALIPLGSGRLGAGWPDPSALAPGQRVGAMLFNNMEGSLPDGRTTPWVVTWKGKGDVRLEGPHVLGEGPRDPQRVEVRIDPDAAGGDGLVSCTWTSPDAADPVRDVHVWLPGTENRGLVFWPPFLEKARSMNAGRGPRTWRTLDWTRVNEYGRALRHGGFTFDLVGTITPDSPSQGTLRGVAVEYQVALCNALGSDLHLQLPHRTDDLTQVEYEQFVLHALQVVRDGSGGFAGLDPRLTVTIELSNEMWNSLFPVNAWMQAEASRKGIPFSQQVAGEIQRLFELGDLVFAGPDAARLRRYVGGFTADPGYLQRVLSFLPAGTRIDALGGAAYLGPRRADLDAWTLNAQPGSCPSCPDAAELLATCERTLVILQGQIAQQRQQADGWVNPDGSHPRLVLYEAGLNLKAGGQPWWQAAGEVMLLPATYDLLASRFVPMLIAEGVDQVNWYSFMTDQDSPLVDGYGMWNDMNQRLAQPTLKRYWDEGAPKAALISLGPPLSAACPLGSAVFRSVPGNLPLYNATPPVLGAAFEAWVDLTGTQHTAAYVVASLLPQSVPLPSGQSLLTSLSGAEYFGTRLGPVPTWRVRLPNDPSLGGICLATQAFLLGGPKGIELSNAMDLEFGR